MLLQHNPFLNFDFNIYKEEEKVVTNSTNNKPHFHGIRQQLPGESMPHHHWQLQLTSQIHPVASVFNSHPYPECFGSVPYYLHAVPYIPHNFDPGAHPPLFAPIIPGGYHPYGYQYVKGNFPTSHIVTLSCSSYPSTQQQNHPYPQFWTEQPHQVKERLTGFQIGPYYQNGVGLGDTPRYQSKSFQQPCSGGETGASVSVDISTQMSRQNSPLPQSNYFSARRCTNQGQCQCWCKDTKYNGEIASLSPPRSSLISGHNSASSIAYPVNNGRVHFGVSDHMKPAQCKFRCEALQLLSIMGKDDIHSSNKKKSLFSSDAHRKEEIQEMPSFSHPQSSLLSYPRPFPNPAVYPAGDEQSKQALELEKAPSCEENSFIFAMPQAQAQGNDATSAGDVDYVNSSKPPIPMSEHEGVEGGSEEENKAYEEESERNSDVITENQMSLTDVNEINEVAGWRAEVESELDLCCALGESSTKSIRTYGDEAVWLWNEKKRRNPAGSPSLHYADGHPAKVQKILPKTQSQDINHPQVKPFHYLDGCEVSMAHANIGHTAETLVAVDRIETSNCGMLEPSRRHCDGEDRGKVQECEKGQIIESEGRSQFKPYSRTDLCQYSGNIQFEDDDMQYFASVFSIFEDEK